MVRYPQEKTPQPSKLPAEPVMPKVVESVTPKVVKDIPPEGGPKDASSTDVPMEAHQDAQGEQVEKLQLRLHSLEEKLKDIQKKTLKDGRPYRVFLVTGAVLCVLTFLAWTFKNHIYVASIGLSLQPKEFNLSGEKSKNFAGNFVVAQEPSNFMSQSFKLYRIRVSTGLDGKSVEARVYSLSPSKARQFADNWEKNYYQQYQNYRKRSLKDRLLLLDRKYGQILNELSNNLGQMAKFKPNEKYFLVNASSREKLDDLNRQKALDLEKDFSGIKLQVTAVNKKNSLHKWSKENKILLDVFKLQLTDMEFRKFLVGPDFLNFYEDGVRAIKASAAKLIKAEAIREHLDETTAALIIKNVFLSCRQQAIEAVLNRKYVVTTKELSDKLSNYVQLKNRSETLYLNLENIIAVEKQIKQALEKGFAQEVAVSKVLNVVKY